jgi:hypothetical protein
MNPRRCRAKKYLSVKHFLKTFMLMQISSPEEAVNYEYEPVEDRRVRTYTTNSNLRYGYDALGRVQTVTVMMRNGVMLTTPEVKTNNYTALGSLQDVYYPNGVPLHNSFLSWESRHRKKLVSEKPSCHKGSIML